MAKFFLLLLFLSEIKNSSPKSLWGQVSYSVMKSGEEKVESVGFDMNILPGEGQSTFVRLIVASGLVFFGGFDLTLCSAVFRVQSLP